jgi:hypothetical protein
MSKFRKVAAVPIKMPKLDLSAAGLAKLFQGNETEDVFNQSNIKQNLSFLASLLAGWTDRYSPSAFYHALETDKNRGYNDTKHSQGAYEEISPELLKLVEDFKKNPPKNLKDLVSGQPISNLENISVPESSNRYKSMRDKLNPSTNNSANANSQSRFIKTSDKNNSDELKNVMPKWSIQDVLSAMEKVAAKLDYSVAERQMEMTNILSQYEKEIAPLSQYLEKNGIQYK